LALSFRLKWGAPLADRLSPQIEDYLKAIYLLEERAGKATTNGIARELSVKPASVTGMIKKLVRLGLVRHSPYQEITLTEAGSKVALHVIRHHRLLELFLVQELGYSWDEVHEEADRLEHVISENLEEKMADRLGNPVVDPHGDPIPGRDGSVAPCGDRTLLDLHDGEWARIQRVAGHGSLLKHAGALGLRPRARVRLILAEPYGGSLRVLVEDAERRIGPEMAGNIYVTEE
jgi:DtxR family transcriptional regulator, Mn-dependent transcriptional regulator